MTIRRFAIATLIFAALTPGMASAHPHVWVTMETEIRYDGRNRIAGLRHRWTFDEFFSVFATQGLDKNGDGKYDRAELAELAKENVSSLKEYDFFTYAKADDIAIALDDPPEDYFLEFDGRNLTLNFTLPLEQPLDPKLATLRYTVYDQTFYVDFKYARTEAPVKVAADAPGGCRAALSEAPKTMEQTALSEAFFQNSASVGDFARQFARDVVVSCNGR